MSKNLGRGPWYAGLLVNRATGKHQIRIHTYCYRIPAILNTLNAKDDWYLLKMMGPYSKLQDALDLKIVDGLQKWIGQPKGALRAGTLLGGKRTKPILLKSMAAIKKMRKS